MSTVSPLSDAIVKLRDMGHVISGTIFNIEEGLPSGYETIVCYTEADYTIAHLSGLWYQNQEVTTADEIIRRALFGPVWLEAYKAALAEAMSRQ